MRWCRYNPLFAIGKVQVPRAYRSSLLLNEISIGQSGHGNCLSIHFTSRKSSLLRGSIQTVNSCTLRASTLHNWTWICASSNCIICFHKLQIRHVFPPSYTIMFTGHHRYWRPRVTTIRFSQALEIGVLWVSDGLTLSEQVLISTRNKVHTVLVFPSSPIIKLQYAPSVVIGMMRNCLTQSHVQLLRGYGTEGFSLQEGSPGCFMSEIVRSTVQVRMHEAMQSWWCQGNNNVTIIM